MWQLSVSSIASTAPVCAALTVGGLSVYGFRRLRSTSALTILLLGCVSGSRCVNNQPHSKAPESRLLHDADGLLIALCSDLIDRTQGLCVLN
jgi:hypothetical protein